MTTADEPSTNGAADVLLLERPVPDVAVVTLNRPDRLNALTEPMVDALITTLNELEDDDTRVVILTGAGRGFCAGLDIADNAKLIRLAEHGSVQAGMRAARSFSRIVPALRRFQKPVIAAVNGPAVGGGFVLALGADLRVMTSSAYFADGFVGVGLSGCELGLGYLLPRLIGASRAMELALTGRRLGPEEASAAGLAHRVTDDGEAVAGALELAAQVTANTPFGMTMTKEILWSSLESGSLESVIALEARSQILALLTADAAEKRSATAEGRSPRYTDQ